MDHWREERPTKEKDSDLERSAQFDDQKDRQNSKFIKKYNHNTVRPKMRDLPVIGISVLALKKLKTFAEAQEESSDE